MSTITVTATVENSTGSLDPPRVRLNVTDTGTSPALFAATVTRLDPDGRVVPVRTNDGNPLVLTTSGTTRVGLLYDYEMPYGAPVTYSTMETPTSSSAAVTVAESKAWLVHPGVPELSRPVTVASVSERTRRAQRGVFYPMGRETPVVQTDGARKAAEYTLGLLTQTDTERRDLGALLSDAGVLLFNVPASKPWGIGAEYVSIGDVTESRVTPFIGEPTRRFELPLTVVDRPAGGSQSERTYIDVLAQFSSYAALRNAYNSYTSLLAGP